MQQPKNPLTFILPILTALALFSSSNAPAQHHDHGGHDKQGAHAEHGEHKTGDHGSRTQITEEMAQEVGIMTVAAGPGVIQETVTAYGTLSVPAGQMAHVRARFPGLITEVQGNIGDTVEQGQILARVEANDSLKNYALRAPISGIITTRHANIGETAQEQVLFTVTQLDPLWAELKIFPSQSVQVSEGQRVDLFADELRQQSTLGRQVPSHSGQPFTVSRAEVINSRGEWTPGLLVEGEITVARTAVPLVVNNQALQPFHDSTAVFIKTGEHYEARPVELGRSDGQFTEVLSGLNVGDQYVVRNSYLIKADLEKSGAAHAH